MGKFFLIFALSFSSLSFAQSLHNPLTKNTNSHLLRPNNSNYKLNLKSFHNNKTELSDYSNKKTLLSEDKFILRKKYNTPIFTPKGTFFLKVFPIDNHIDYKIEVIPPENTTYDLRFYG